MIWTDGSRLDVGKVGAVVVWWREAHTPPPWVGPHTGATHHPLRKEVVWTGRRLRLGNNKEVFDAEV